MIDRLVCADGGNPDPTSTGGKDPERAKELELEGWPYPRHLAGRVFSVVVHGDAAGAENLRRILSDWLTDIGLIAAGHMAQLGTLYRLPRRPMRRAMTISTAIPTCRMKCAMPRALWCRPSRCCAAAS